MLGCRLVRGTDLAVGHTASDKQDQASLGLVPATFVVERGLGRAQGAHSLAGLDRLQLVGRQGIGVLFAVQILVDHAL